MNSFVLLRNYLLTRAMGGVEFQMPPPLRSCPAGRDQASPADTYTAVQTRRRTLRTLETAAVSITTPTTHRKWSESSVPCSLILRHKTFYFLLFSTPYFNSLVVLSMGLIIHSMTIACNEKPPKWVNNKRISTAAISVRDWGIESVERRRRDDRGAKQPKALKG